MANHTSWFNKYFFLLQVEQLHDDKNPQKMQHKLKFVHYHDKNPAIDF